MKTALFITCILATLAVLANSAQNGSPPKSPAPAPSVDCSDVAVDMLDCVTYLSDGNAEKPTDSCCAGLEAVLSLDDECLCFALKHSADFGVAVNLTRAAALSSECGVSAHPLSRCGSEWFNTSMFHLTGIIYNLFNKKFYLMICLFCMNVVSVPPSGAPAGTFSIMFLQSQSENVSSFFFFIIWKIYFVFLFIHRVKHPDMNGVYFQLENTRRQDY